MQKKHRKCEWLRKNGSENRKLRDSFPGIKMTALSGPQPLTPVSRAPCMVRKGNDKDYPVTFANDDAIRKTPEEQTLDAVRARDAEQRCKRDNLLLENIQGRNDCVFEIRPESGPLTFVPRSSFASVLFPDPEGPVSTVSLPGLSAMFRFR